MYSRSAPISRLREYRILQRPLLLNVELGLHQLTFSGPPQGDLFGVLVFNNLNTLQVPPSGDLGGVKTKGAKPEFLKVPLSRTPRLLAISVVLIAFVALVIAGCASNPRYTRYSQFKQPGSSTSSKTPAAIGTTETGVASYYGSEFHGRKTANDEKYDMYKMTAAHRTLPFGTNLKVTNLDNGKVVNIRVNDRGPFKKNRIIDLSYQAARDIFMIGNGTANVKIEVTGN